MDLTALIEFTLPGSVARVTRSPEGIEADPWPDIGTWSNADYQNALDTLVTWADGVTPPAGAAVRANIAAWQASIPTQAELDELRREAEADRLLSRAADETFLDGHWITLRAMAAGGITVSVPAIADAVASNDRTAFNKFFHDQIKSRLA